MAKKQRKKDQVGLVGIVSVIARNLAQQRSLERAREKRLAKSQPKPPKPPKPKKPKDTRTPEQLAAAADVTRQKLVTTVDEVKYDIDVPARLRDARDDLARQLPKEVRGEPKATIAGITVLVTGLGAIAWGTVARLRTRS